MKHDRYDNPPSSLPRPAPIRQILHMGHLCILGIRRSQLTRMAAALTYRTIFSLIPVLVIGLVVLGAFSSKEMVGTAVSSMLKFAGLSNIVVSQPPIDPAIPLVAGEATHLDSWISSLVEGIHKLPFRTIGFVGILTLIYAALSMLVEIENAFNDIYHSPTGRSWKRRIPQYWALLTLGPIFLFASFGVTERVMRWVEALPESSIIAFIEGEDPASPGVDAGSRARPSEEPPPPAEALFQAAGEANPSNTDSPITPAPRPRSRLSQTLVTAAGFAVSVTISTILLLGVYATVPNTRVFVGPAFIGAIVGATLWEAGKWGFTTYVKFSTGYSQFYGTLALLPLFFLWVYVTWMIVLFGLQLAHSIQTYRVATAAGYSDSVLETLGLMARKVAAAPLRLLDSTALVRVMAVVAERFARGDSTDHAHAAKSTGIDDHTVSLMLERLAKAGLIRRVSDEEQEGSYTLARPPERIALEDILLVAEDAAATQDQAPPDGAASRLLRQFNEARRRAAEGKSLADAIDSMPSAAPPNQTPLPSALPHGA